MTANRRANVVPVIVRAKKRLWCINAAAHEGLVSCTCVHIALSGEPYYILSMFARARLFIGPVIACDSKNAKQIIFYEMHTKKSNISIRHSAHLGFMYGLL